ncbi:MAG: phosphate/phosphite/phosphonate ABC transporter substrate-binding protein [Sphingobium sp.]
MKRGIIIIAALVLAGVGGWFLWPSAEAQPPVLRVLLIPADGGTQSGTLADYQPIFNAISRADGLHFDLKVAQSYGAVVEALCNDAADIAFVGPTTYLQAHDRKCANLLAVGSTNGQSIYYAGLFVRKDAPITSLVALRGKRVAFGDVNSTSSFIYPMSMLIRAGIDPARDLAEVRVAGSHANALAALLQGDVDAAALSFESYEKAVRENVPGVRDVKVIARSDPIPYPPLVVSTRMSPAVLAQLKTAFSTIAKQPGITPDMLRGYGGAKVDAYDTAFPPERFDAAATRMAAVDDRMKSAILRKAGAR